MRLKSIVTCGYCHHRFNPAVEIVKNGGDPDVYCGCWCAGGAYHKDERELPEWSESWIVDRQQEEYNEGIEA